jgi:hypothetical protein
LMFFFKEKRNFILWIIICTCLLRCLSFLYCCRSWLISSDKESSMVFVLCVVGKFE